MSKMVKRQLQLAVATARSINGVEMGVFADGSSFLTGRGLAAVCGVVPSVVNQMANEFDANSGKPRDEAIHEILEEQGYEGEGLFFKTMFNGQEVNAYPEVVCMAVLEYYAHIADRSTEQARRSLRLFQRAGLRAFVYSNLGYDPTNQVPERFKSYHDRVLLNRMPNGYFSCFSETSHMILESIRAGLQVDDHTVPDISVGKAWSTHWTGHDLESRFGARVKYSHTYPDDYPQSAANDVIEAYTYPLAALGEFRLWLDREYLSTKYPKYLQTKVRQGVLPPSRAELLIASLVPPQFGSGDDVDD
jgi:hypothetical protein